MQQGTERRAAGLRIPGGDRLTPGNAEVTAGPRCGNGPDTKRKHAPGSLSVDGQPVVPRPASEERSGYLICTFPREPDLRANGEAAVGAAGRAEFAARFADAPVLSAWRESLHKLAAMKDTR